MAGLLVVFFPFVLLAFMILMERVESPLRTAAVAQLKRRRRLPRLLNRRPVRRGRHAA